MGKDRDGCKDQRGEKGKRLDEAERREKNNGIVADKKNGGNGKEGKLSSSEEGKDGC